MTKICYRCKVEQPTSLFRKNSKQADGLHSWCTPCFAKYEADRYQNGDRARKERNKANTIERSRTHIWNYLLNNPCVDCGQTDPRVLEFDHRDDLTKSYNVSEMFPLSLSKINEEIAKCDVRCANCHRIRTSIQFNTWRNIVGEVLR